MTKNILRAFLAVGALAIGCASSACVADRPSRNGVFNENQYIRKDFLIRSGTGGTDPGWFMKTTLVSSTTPNPFMANPNSLFVGSESAVKGGYSGFIPFVRFVITSDKLQVVNMRELSSSNSPTGTTGSPAAQATRDAEVLNAWPITNVDLKYEINLDGEITNFFSENQEADWQERQWVKVNLDKNDMSDMAPLGEGVVAYLELCGDVNVSTTLVPGSFVVDEANNYMTWQVQITVPVNTTNSSCLASYGDVGTEFMHFGRQDVTMNLMYSFVRVAPDSGKWDNVNRGCAEDLSCPPSTYVPFVLDEKDPIQRKYGLLQALSIDRDPKSGLLAANSYVQRLNPNQEWDYTLYLAPGFPAVYEPIFCGYEPGKGLLGLPVTDDRCGGPGTGGLVDQTNAIWKDGGIKLRMRVMHSDDDKVFGDHASSNPKVFGDLRYSFIRFLTDIDSTPPGLLGVTEPLSDPRTGELISNSVNITNIDVADFYVTRLQFYLETIAGTGPDQSGSTWKIENGNFVNTPKETCAVGDLLPLGSSPGGLDNSMGGAVQTNHNAISTVFQKMQQYLHKPLTTYGYLGPDDFIPLEGPDFYKAFYRLMPYQMFADPAGNPYVIQEGGSYNYAPGSAAALTTALSNQGQFSSFMANIDQGNAPFDPMGQDGQAQAQAFTAEWQSLSKGYTDSRWLMTGVNPAAKLDTADSILTYFNNFEHAGRHCVVNAANPTPHWESLSEWAQDLTVSTWTYTIWHEFGHSLGLDHNFMGSIDRRNYPTWTDAHGNTQVGFYSSSIMEYPTDGGDLFPVAGPSQGDAKNGIPPGKALSPDYNGRPGWMPYDVAALSFIYSNATCRTGSTGCKPNDAPKGTPCTGGSGCSVSGQVTAAAPWNDAAGFVGDQETEYLWCTDRYVRYSPFCQTFDFGTTPSEIVASALDNEEWNYKWTNFRLYHKFWNDSGYAGGRAFFYHDLLRFISSWTWDWNAGTVPENLTKLGVTPPNGVPEQYYYAAITDAFQNDISVANQLVAAFHLAMVEQASGERPYITTFDPFYGDVTQQGIIIDKNYALANYTNLYPVDNYDPSRSAGQYLFAATPLAADYQSLTENVVSQFVGGQYDIFLYDQPLAVSNFATATQNLYFAQAPINGRASIRQWIGAVGLFGNGAAGIDPDQEFLDWAANLAALWGFGCDASGQNCGPGVSPCSTTQLAACTWDPRQHQTNSEDVYHSDSYNEFRGPDNRRYAWALIKDRLQILLVDRDVNTATYVVVRNWNTDVTYQMDDGSGPAYSLELPMKYFLDAYNANN
jgi:hypothetical protein